MALIDYLRLGRVPNVFTAVADVWAGFVLVRGTFSWDSAGLLASLTAASALIYTAGMVLNDVFDIEIDRQERPERPLPSGRVPLGVARWLGGAMLLGGVGLAWLAGHLFSSPPALALGPAIVALALAASVLLYDGGAKKTPLGPWVMGLCRGLNLALGMTAISTTAPLFLTGNWLGLAPTIWLLPLGATLYIAGLTWFGRHEVEQQQSAAAMAPGIIVLALGLAVIGGFPLLTSVTLRIRPPWLWLVLFAALAWSVLRPFLQATQAKTPAAVQRAIKHGIMSLITLDAIIAFYGATEVWIPLVIVALFLPARFAGRWVYST